MKTLALILLLPLLTSCLPEISSNADAGGENETPSIPTLGVEVKVAYIHLRALTYVEMYDSDATESLRDLWQEYDAVYMNIQAGEGLRSWDFGSVKLMYDLPMRVWTTENSRYSNNWHLMASQESTLEDNHPHDYSWSSNGFLGEFIKAPFAMHYRHQDNNLVRFNVIGTHIDATNYTQEINSMKRVISQSKTSFWNTPGTITFGNLTKDCQNTLGGLVIRNSDNSCAEESVVITEELTPKIGGVIVIYPEENPYNILTNKPMIEVRLNL